MHQITDRTLFMHRLTHRQKQSSNVQYEMQILLTPNLLCTSSTSIHFTSRYHGMMTCFGLGSSHLNKVSSVFVHLNESATRAKIATVYKTGVLGPLLLEFDLGNGNEVSKIDPSKPNLSCHSLTFIQQFFNLPLKHAAPFKIIDNPPRHMLEAHPAITWLAYWP